MDRLQMSCEGFELRPKTSETISGAYKEDCSKRWGAQRENRRAAMFVDEDCVDSESRRR